MHLYRPIIHRRPTLFLPKPHSTILLLFPFERCNPRFEQRNLLLLLLELTSLLLYFFVRNTLARRCQLALYETKFMRAYEVSQSIAVLLPRDHIWLPLVCHLRARIGYSW